MAEGEIHRGIEYLGIDEPIILFSVLKKAETIFIILIIFLNKYYEKKLVNFLFIVQFVV